MIVDQVYVYGLAIFETEDDTPVAGDPHTPCASAVSLQGMQPEARRVRTARMNSFLEPEQDTAKPWHLPCRHSRRVVPLMQRPQSLVFEFHDKV